MDDEIGAISAALSIRRQALVLSWPSILGSSDSEKEIIMLHPKTRLFPTGLKQNSTFDIFKRLPDGNFTGIAAVRGLAEARRRINRLAKQNTGHYLIHSQGLVF